MIPCFFSFNVHFTAVTPLHQYKTSPTFIWRGCDEKKNKIDKPPASWFWQWPLWWLCWGGCPWLYSRCRLVGHPATLYLTASTDGWPAIKQTDDPWMKECIKIMPWWDLWWAATLLPESCNAMQPYKLPVEELNHHFYDTSFSLLLP